MSSYILTISIPFFLFLIWVEYQVAKHKKLPYFNFSTSVSNICIGIAERLSDLFLAGIFYSVFDYVQKHLAFFHFESSITLYFLLLIITDFIWYCYHRCGHEINLLWAVHIVHHQSEDFNYTVSARITIFQSFVRLLFWSILPLIGFPAEMVTTVLMIHGVYPFFVHTRVIKKLGILEKIFVTPSHHRVHHASNEKYLDKNYGSILIVWDKLFDTFTEEKEEPVYGLTSQLNSHSFLWQHFHYYLELWQTARTTKGVVKKLKIFFGRPDSISSNARKQLEKKFLLGKNSQPSIRPAMRKYIILQLTAAVVLLTSMYIVPFTFSSAPKTVGLSFLLLITLINICAILEQRTWIFYLEYTRLLVVLALSIVVFNNTYVLLLTFFFAGFILYYFRVLNKLFISFIYGSVFYYRSTSNYRNLI